MGMDDSAVPPPGTLYARVRNDNAIKEDFLTFFLIIFFHSRNFYMTLGI